MNFLHSIWKIVIDALFPLSREEQELLGMKPEEVMGQLPMAPAFDATVAHLRDTSAVFAYKDARVSRLVWCIKNKKSAHAVRLGGRALYENLPKDRRIVLVPIPITKRRRRERGYNQCELLADEIKALDTENRISCEFDLLRRVANNTEQKTKSRNARFEGSKNIFFVNTGIAERLIRDQSHIIVLDDVITTGSTLRAAQTLLIDAGFLNVGGISLAH